MGNRYSTDKLEQLVRLRVPSDITASQGDNQNRAGTVPGPPHCPVLASPDMVSETGQAADSDPTDPAPQARHLTTTVRDRTPETTGPSFDLLASLQRYFQTAGLSKDAAAMAARGRRASTRQVYSSRLRHLTRGGGSDLWIQPQHL